MLIKIVAKKPPGSSPGITSLASTPAMRPITSQDMNLIPSLLSFSEASNSSTNRLVPTSVASLH